MPRTASGSRTASGERTSILGATTSLDFFWKFDGNADDSIGTNHATVSGPTLTTDRNAKVNSAYNFNSASSQFMSLPQRIVNSENAHYSICFWAKWASLDDALVISDNFNGTEVISIGLTNDIVGAANTIKFFTFLNGSSERPVADSGVVPVLEQWYHVAATYEHNATFTLRVQKIYIDGVLKATVSPVVAGGTSQGGGNTYYFGRFGAKYFNGVLDDVRSYRKVLSQDEITTLQKIYHPRSASGARTAV